MTELLYWCLVINNLWVFRLLLYNKRKPLEMLVKFLNFNFQQQTITDAYQQKKQLSPKLTRIPPTWFLLPSHLICSTLSLWPLHLQSLPADPRSPFADPYISLKSVGFWTRWSTLCNLLQPECYGHPCNQGLLFCLISFSSSGSLIHTQLSSNWVLEVKLTTIKYIYFNDNNHPKWTKEKRKENNGRDQIFLGSKEN